MAAPLRAVDQRTTLVEIMAVEALPNPGVPLDAGLTTASPDKYMSVRPAWTPAGHTTAYGGHVFAQAVWAAAQTVGEGLVIHVCSIFYFVSDNLIDRLIQWTGSLKELTYIISQL